MSNERAQTGGEGVTTDGNPSVSDQQRGDVGLDELFEVLANEERRRLLGYLESTDEHVVTFSELVEHVTDESDALSNDDRDRAAVNLHHNHLPKLEAANVAEYDPRSETVRYRGEPVVGDWVELARDYESAHHRL
jgi:hypothetical protein